MAFLSPWFLLGLLAVAGPLIAHLRRLSVQDRIQFSAVDFLQPRPPQSAKRRWEDIALLIARILALALLALAFARPYFKTAGGVDASASGRTRRLVVLLDRSASMQRGAAFTEALAKVREIAAAASDVDALEIAWFDRKAQILLGSELWAQTARVERPTLVEGLLAGLKPGFDHARLDEALRFAVEEHSAVSERTQTEVVVVSDFQEGTSLAGLQGFDWPKGVVVRLEYVPAGNFKKAQGDTEGDKQGDTFVHWLSPEGQEANPEAPFRIQVSVDPAFKGDRLKLRMESANAMEWSAGVQPGRVTTLGVPAPPVDSGYIRVDGSQDFGAGAWVARVPQKRALVAVAGVEESQQRTGSRYFLERALAALGTGRVEMMTAASLAAGRDAEVALWLLAGSADADWTRRMRVALENGATGLATIEDAGDGKALSALTGGTVTLTEAALDGYALLGMTDRTHPVFATFSTPQFADFSALRFWKYRKMQLGDASKASVLARFEGGDPAVVEFPVGAGRLIVWASGWHSRDGQWVLSSRCVPFLSGCLDYAGGGRRPFLVGVPGELITLPEETRSLKRSDGLSILVQDARAVLEEPGVYGMEPQGGVVVVNVARDERRFGAMLPAQLEALGFPLVKASESGASLPRSEEAIGAGAISSEVLAARDLESKQSWWRLVLGAAVALMGVETVWAARMSSARGTIA